MQIVTANQARKAQIETLFQPGGTARAKPERFDMGKYRGAPADYVGREVPDVRGVVAVYPVSRKDADGPYVALLCYSRSED